MSLYSEYETYMKTYIEEYGPDTIVLYRCGGFYEIYSINDGLVDMKRISDLLNIQVSRRNKSILEVNRSNTLMAGFPVHALNKFIGILLQDKYTIVIVDQISEAPKPKRAVTAVLSPGTDINSNIITIDSHNLMSIYVDYVRDIKTKTNVMVLGISLIDLTTGTSSVFEVASTVEDSYLALDEAYRIIRIYNPCEIVFIGQDIGEDIKYLEVGDICTHNLCAKYDKEIEKLSYQTQLLTKVFPNHGCLSVIEYLDLEKLPLATISFVYLLQFSFKHNDNILTKIQKPQIIENSGKLILSYNCVKHLNIIEQSKDAKINSLLSLLNRCSTAMGKRKYKDMFLNPITDASVLEERYDIVDKLLIDKTYEKIQKHLVEIYDIERLSRRINLRTLNPCELSQLHTSLSESMCVYNSTKDIIVNKDILNLDEILLDIVQFIESTLDMTEIQKYIQDNICRSFFKQGVISRLDIQDRLLQDKLHEIEKLVYNLNQQVKADVFKFDFNQVDGYFLTITSKRLNDAASSLKDFVCSVDGQQFDFKSIQKKQNTAQTGIKIQHPVLRSITSSVDSIQIKLSKMVKDEYLLFLDSLSERYGDKLQILANFIGTVDVYITNAHNAYQYRYYRPKITNKYNDKSFVEGNDLRHPIIEQICSCAYVPNNVSIGVPEQNSILLYGTNMVGKSAYMKSIGIAIIMAQAGMFVPCCNFNFFPYQHIFTRIPSGDDLFKGQSTFAVEITELRNILKRANDRSLVIGDELASGTESISAVSIVAAGILQLITKQTSFVFATHLHDLTKLEKIKSLDTLKVYHLSVMYDDSNKTLIFDRKLKEGQGSTLYGLEVCRALGLTSEFLMLANEFRHELTDTVSSIVSTKKSRYNTSHYIDTCGICRRQASEVHHIQHQVDADANGFIGHVHKNAKHNLLSVCESCHDKIHNKEITVNGYIQTSNGLVIDIVENAKEDDITELVHNLKSRKYSLVRIQEEIKKIKGITVTIYKLRKILQTK